MVPLDPVSSRLTKTLPRILILISWFQPARGSCSFSIKLFKASILGCKASSNLSVGKQQTDRQIPVDKWYCQKIAKKSSKTQKSSFCSRSLPNFSLRINWTRLPLLCSCRGHIPILGLALRRGPNCDALTTDYGATLGFHLNCRVQRWISKLPRSIQGAPFFPLSKDLILNISPSGKQMFSSKKTGADHPIWQKKHPQRITKNDRFKTEMTNARISRGCFNPDSSVGCCLSWLTTADFTIHWYPGTSIYHPVW